MSHNLSFLGFVLILGLDVARTDRSLVFYEKQENLSKLWDILSVYAWFDKDVNYCQGGLSQYLLEINFFSLPWFLFDSTITKPQ